MLSVRFDKKHAIAILEPGGVLSESDFVSASHKIDTFLNEHSVLDGLIIYTKDFPGWDSFSALCSHLKFVNNHHEKISFLAFVTDSIVVDFVKIIAEHFVHPEIKVFSFNELENAKEWIIKSRKG
ncbi:STAS/SEC14 domain-containing protein [Sulfurospirillum sp. 1307]|jgi:hypothetical protein